MDWEAEEIQTLVVVERKLAGVIIPAPFRREHRLVRKAYLLVVRARAEAELRAEELAALGNKGREVE